MKSAAVLLVLAVAAVSALPTPSEETKGSREGRTLAFAPASTSTFLLPGTYHVQFPGQPPVLFRGYQPASLTLPQQPVLQVPAFTSSLIDTVLDGVGQLISSALTSAAAAAGSGNTLSISAR